MMIVPDSLPDSHTVLVACSAVVKNIDWRARYQYEKWFTYHVEPNAHWFKDGKHMYLQRASGYP
jgi:hypothetical protein